MSPRIADFPRRRQGASMLRHKPGSTPAGAHARTRPAMAGLPLLAIALLLACAGTSAAGERPPTARFVEPEVPIRGKLRIVHVESPGLATALKSQGILSEHPDISWRTRGEQSYALGQYDLALKQFMRAARYSDKQAQALLARMYREGTGVARDPEAGYAWMALAAERGRPDFVRQRARFWSELDAAQRCSAARRSEQLFAEYRDRVAIRRLEQTLRRARRQATGSRVGFAGKIDITASKGSPDATGKAFSGEDFYASDRWRAGRTSAHRDDAGQASSAQQACMEDVERSTRSPGKAASGSPRS